MRFLKGSRFPDEVLQRFQVCYVSCVMCHVSCVMCHVSCVMCHVSCVMCHVSCVMCHVSCAMCHVCLCVCLCVCVSVCLKPKFGLSVQSEFLGSLETVTYSV